MSATDGFDWKTELDVPGEGHGKNFHAPGFLSKEEFFQHLEEGHFEVESLLRSVWDSVVLLTNRDGSSATGFLIAKPPVPMSWREDRTTINAFASHRNPFLIITNAHVVLPTQVSAWTVRFLYDTTESPALVGQLTRAIWHSQEPAATEANPSFLDYTVAEFTPPADLDLSRLKPITMEDCSARLVEREDPIAIIGHPRGAPKKGSFSNAKEAQTAKSSIFNYNGAATRPGSSGSPVFCLKPPKLSGESASGLHYRSGEAVAFFQGISEDIRLQIQLSYTKKEFETKDEAVAWITEQGLDLPAYV